MAALEAAIGAKDATIAALTVRALRAEGEADRLIASVQAERIRADQAEVRADGANIRADKAEATLTAEQTAREKAEADAMALQQADQERRRRGLLERLRSAWRCE